MAKISYGIFEMKDGDFVIYRKKKKLLGGYKEYLHASVDTWDWTSFYEFAKRFDNCESAQDALKDVLNQNEVKSRYSVAVIDSGNL